MARSPCIWVVDRWAHLHGAPRQAQLQSPGRLARASPLRHHQLALRGQRSSGLQQLARACGASVNEQPRQAVPTQPPRSAPVVVRVATSVTNADPSMASGGTPKRLQNQGPDLGLKAFALLALDTVLGALAGRPAATSPTPLGGKAEDLPGCAKRHQAVHHQAAASVIADGTVALGRSHVREVQLCGVLYKKHETRAGFARLERLLEMRLHQGFSGDLGAPKKSISCLGPAPRLRLLRDALARCLEHVQGQHLRPSRAPRIAQVRLAKLFGNPLLIVVHWPAPPELIVGRLFRCG